MNKIKPGELGAFIFIGRSGCGKGTQAKLLLEHLRTAGVINEQHPLYQVETGSHFREFIAGTNHSQLLAKAVMERSDRQPDFLAVWIWSNALINNLTGQEHLFFDGTPRSLLEAHILDTALRFYGPRQVFIINLDVSRAWAEQRLRERGRADDLKSDDITKRLDWYDKDVAPAVAYYRDQSQYNFWQINGERSIEEIHQDIIARL